MLDRRLPTIRHLTWQNGSTPGPVPQLGTRPGGRPATHPETVVNEPSPAGTRRVTRSLPVFGGVAPPEAVTFDSPLSETGADTWAGSIVCV